MRRFTNDLKTQGDNFNYLFPKLSNNVCLLSDPETRKFSTTRFTSTKFFFSWQYEPRRRACYSPRMENLLLHIWNVQIDSNDLIIYTAKKIYITRRRGLCYIIIFLQSYSYLHTALLKWRLTTDSISENGGGGFLPTPWIYRRHLPHSMFMFVFRNNVLLKIINIWFLFCNSIQGFFFTSGLWIVM